MQTVNDVTENQKKEYRYHYAALYPLYINAKTSQIEGHARLWVRKRWDPKKNFENAEYESITFEMQTGNNDFKLEAWVFDNRLIIQVTDNERTIKSGLHPSSNYHIDLNDPDSIESAIKVIERYLSESQPETYTIDNKEELFQHNKNVFEYWVTIITFATLTFLIWRLLK